MSSILTNASALSALQSLTQTQAALKTTESQVSTGLAVSSAADNASYWSIATQLSSDSGVVTAANSALAQSQSVLSTASSAINSVITTINSIEIGADPGDHPGREHQQHPDDARFARQQLTDAVNGASFNGLNVLDGSQTRGAEFRRRLQRHHDRRHDQHDLVHHQLADRHRQPASPRAATAGSGILEGGTGTGGRRGHRPADPRDDRLPTPRPPRPRWRASPRCSTNVTNYAATIGATQDRMTAASTFNSALTTNYSTGVSALVDADMNTASTRLQALQTQEQLGIQSLSIANQNAQLILKLFP